MLGKFFLLQMFTELINGDTRTRRISGHVEILTLVLPLLYHVDKCGFCRIDCYYLAQTQKGSVVLCKGSMPSPCQEGMCFELFPSSGGCWTGPTCSTVQSCLASLLIFYFNHLWGGCRGDGYCLPPGLKLVYPYRSTPDTVFFRHWFHRKGRCNTQG